MQICLIMVDGSPYNKLYTTYSMAVQEAKFIKDSNPRHEVYVAPCNLIGEEGIVKSDPIYIPDDPDNDYAERCVEAEQLEGFYDNYRQEQEDSYQIEQHIDDLYAERRELLVSEGKDPEDRNNYADINLHVKSLLEDDNVALPSDTYDGGQDYLPF